jgi:hypothetical protein
MGRLAPRLRIVEQELPADADLARIISAWPTLPAPIKAAVLALLDAAK